MANPNLTLPHHYFMQKDEMKTSREQPNESQLEYASILGIMNPEKIGEALKTKRK